MLEARAGFERPAQVDALGGGQQLDGDDLAAVPGDLRQAACRVGRHGDVVLLVRRGRQTVDARRMGQPLVFAGQRGGGDLGVHEARVEPRLGDQKGGQGAHVGVGEQRDAALGQRADLR